MNSDIISIPGAKLGQVAKSLMYKQDQDTYDTIVIVAGNNNYYERTSKS